MAEQLLLTRHGRIAANEQGRWHGATDSPLLPVGLRQARRLGRHLREEGPELAAIYTSPLARCRDTADAVARELNRPALKAQRRARLRARAHRLTAGLLGRDVTGPEPVLLAPQQVDDLREYAIGAWEDMPFTELAGTHRFIERARADHDFAPPEGESLRQVGERMAAALEDIDRRHGPDESVLVVSHGAALGVALASLLNQDPGKWVDYHFDNCSVSHLRLAPPPELVHFNLRGHL